jgi:hypothetical protein
MRRLTLLPDRYAVCRLAPDQGVGLEPAPRTAAGPALRSVTRTPAEVSVVCPEAEIPVAAIGVELGWRAFEVEGPIPFTETGVLSGFTSVLAANGISVFVISTYDTDYLLVPESQLERAQELLGR